MAGRRTRGRSSPPWRLLFGVLSLSNFTKALQHARDPRTLGIVVFGVRYESTAANVILGAVMGIVLGAYAYGVWNLRRWWRRFRRVRVLRAGESGPLLVLPDRARHPAPRLHPRLPAFAVTGSIGTALYSRTTATCWRDLRRRGNAGGG